MLRQDHLVPLKSVHGRNQVAEQPGKVARHSAQKMSRLPGDELWLG